jgi:hypothetical protein
MSSEDAAFRDLIGRVRAGDEAAATQLVREYESSAVSCAFSYVTVACGASLIPWISASRCCALFLSGPLSSYQSGDEDATSRPRLISWYFAARGGSE